MLTAFAPLRLCRAILLLLISTTLAFALDTNRVAEIAAWLPAKPCGPGPSISDRAAWKALAAHPSYQKLLRDAEELTKRPIEEQSDELYLDFSRTGNRGRWQRVASRRRRRIATLTLAECIENKRRFIPALDEIIRAVCNEKTWVLPAHDRSLDDFYQRIITIDLASSALGWNLAMVEHFLGSRLPTETRALMRLRIRERILIPYRKTIEGKHRRNWWYRCNHNWNAVCVACATGTALIAVESPEERARFVDGAETAIRKFLSGFTADGYCSEGMGYWNYGYGHFILLTDNLSRATGGRLDLFTLPGARPAALLPLGLEIVSDVYPAFADCSVGSRPTCRYLAYISARYGLNLPEYENADTIAPSGMLAETMLFSFPDAWRKAPPTSTEPWDVSPLRSWFKDAGVLVCRPQRGKKGRFGVALKGGHNAEHHNHNDVGSYVVVLNGKAVLLDPGAEVYTARTFSGKRYVSKVLNSYGHPVPIVGGRLQEPGATSRATFLKSDFTDTEDTSVIDLKAAYRLGTLTKLEREFVYSRADAGSMTVTDTVACSQPETFETALVTLGDWSQVRPGELIVWSGGQTLKVEIDARGKAYDVAAEQIDEDVRTRRKPTRIGIRLREPAESATVRLSISPADLHSLNESGELLMNGSFELGGWMWSLGSGAVAAVTDEDASDGKHCLKITDTRKTKGSSIYGHSIDAEPNTTYELRGKVRHLSGEGVGLYAFCRDSTGRRLNKSDRRGNVAAFATIKAGGKEWEAFSHTFTTPAETASLQIWIHSYNASVVTAYLDELVLVKKP